MRGYITSKNSTPNKKKFKSRTQVREILKLMPLATTLLTFWDVLRGFPGGLVVKNLPATQETQIHSLGWEDLLEMETAMHSNILA